MHALFADEKIIVEGDVKQVILTNKRIWKENIDGGKSFYQSIMLPHVSSIQSVIEDYVILLIIGGLFILAALYYIFLNDNSPFATTAGILGIFFIIFYFLTRGSTVIIGSSSAKIKLSIKGMKKEQVLHFIDLVENAINEGTKSKNAI